MKPDKTAKPLSPAAESRLLCIIPEKVGFLSCLEALRKIQNQGSLSLMTPVLLLSGADRWHDPEHPASGGEAAT